MFKLLKKRTRKNAMAQVTPDEWRKKNHSCLTCEYYNQEETMCKAKNELCSPPLTGSAGNKCVVYSPEEFIDTKKSRHTTARWLVSRESYCKGEVYCSACRWFTEKNASHKPMYSNYCPHCGSVMENTKN